MAREDRVTHRLVVWDSELFGWHWRIEDAEGQWCAQGDAANAEGAALRGAERLMVVHQQAKAR